MIDTRRFLGRKDATITVRFDLPFPAEVQLHTHCYIRSDVVIQPGEIRFPSASLGAGDQQRATVSYAGRTDWRIERVESSSPYLEAHVVESPDSNRALGQIKYDLLVNLKPETPAGYLRAELTLVTNDYSAQSARIPVMVEAMVVSPLTVRPSPLLMPVLCAGQSATRQLVVQASTPFRITGIECADPRFSFKLPEEARRVQLIPVTFIAEGTPGRVSQRIKILTDLPHSPSAEVVVNVQVIEGPAGAESPASQSPPALAPSSGQTPPSGQTSPPVQTPLSGQTPPSGQAGPSVETP